MQTGHPVIRDVDTYSDPAVTLTMINTGLSLDLSHTSPELSPKKDCVEKITGSVESQKHKVKKKNSETHIVATDTPHTTRNGGVRKGIFDNKVKPSSDFTPKTRAPNWHQSQRRTQRGPGSN